MTLRSNISASASPGSANVGSPLLDRAQLEAARAELPESFAQLLGYFFDDAGRYLARMEQALARQDLLGLVPPAHLSKSAGRQLGLVRVGRVAGLLEQEAREGLAGDRKRLAPLAARTAELREALEHTRELLVNEGLM